MATSLRHLILTNIFHKETKDMSHISEEERKRILNEKLEKLREMYGYMPHTAQVPGLAVLSQHVATSRKALSWAR